MTSNDVGHWQRVNATSTDPNSPVLASDPTPTYVYQPVQPTSGIILDQKVLVGLVLVIGIVVGISIILVVDKYKN
jgi:hypothetical protein